MLKVNGQDSSLPTTVRKPILDVLKNLRETIGVGSIEKRTCIKSWISRDKISIE